jgi:hypothetical protein
MRIHLQNASMAAFGRRPLVRRFVGAAGQFSLGAKIHGSDFLMDGGVTASYWFGDLAPK